MAEITLESLTKVYPDGTQAVTDLDLEVGSGEFVVFVGPSGCGKTTALRMIAGLETITSGQVVLDGKVINDLPPKDRDIAMVFQNYALYPHMNAAKNMGFPLKMRGLPQREIDIRVGEAARVLGLSDTLHKKPRTLSGGQRQRVAMGRAIVRQPAAFLMDEPLSNLDAKLRVQMRAEIARIQRDLGVTTIYVTHDQSEAMTLGDRVCVMRGGYLQQVDRPQVLYDAPANLFVGGFIGSPAMNLVEAEVVERDGGLVVRFGPHELPAPAALAARGRVALGIRPEDIRAGGGGAPLDVTVDIKEDMGAEVYLHFAVDAPPVKSGELREIVGDEALEAAEEQTHHHGSPFIARVERGTSAREGEPARLYVDTARLHFFDAETGDSLAAAPAAVAA
ncbi:MAG TPA: sn-glycerol-3-phosphate ABC transporter ATP-binding protein UgpC [Gaiellaceae bacterium]|nr:sn-glycerol-3-phosphate ABC transporter ATP-binding protein UgpC [Gaiellaceae bacterium]